LPNKTLLKKIYTTQFSTTQRSQQLKIVVKTNLLRLSALTVNFTVNIYCRQKSVWSGTEKADGLQSQPTPYTTNRSHTIALQNVVTTKLLHVYYTLSSLDTQNYVNRKQKNARYLRIKCEINALL
jgi:hypothetical protein